MHFTEAKLLAYAGNELDPSDASVLEDRMAAEPDLARRAVAALLQRRLGEKPADSSAPRTMKPSLPAIEAVETRRRRDRAATSPARIWPVPAAIAAVLLVGVGYISAQWMTSGTPAVGLGRIEVAALQSALEQIPTGGAEEVRGSTFRAIASFVAGDGSLCREFSLAGGSGTSDAVACRRSQGWTVTFALLKPLSDPDYLPADGADAMSAYLSDVGASRALSGRAELDLLSGKP